RVRYEDMILSRVATIRTDAREVVDSVMDPVISASLTTSSTGWRFARKRSLGQESRRSRHGRDHHRDLVEIPARSVDLHFLSLSTRSEKSLPKAGKFNEYFYHTLHRETDGSWRRARHGWSRGCKTALVAGAAHALVQEG